MPWAQLLVVALGTAGVVGLVPVMRDLTWRARLRRRVEDLAAVRDLLSEDSQARARLAEWIEAEAANLAHYQAVLEDERAVKAERARARMRHRPRPIGPVVAIALVAVASTAGVVALADRDGSGSDVGGSSGVLLVLGGAVLAVLVILAILLWLTRPSRRR